MTDRCAGSGEGGARSPNCLGAAAATPTSKRRSGCSPRRPGRRSRSTRSTSPAATPTPWPAAGRARTTSSASDETDPVLRLPQPRRRVPRCRRRSNERRRTPSPRSWSTPPATAAAACPRAARRRGSKSPRRGRAQRHDTSVVKSVGGSLLSGGAVSWPCRSDVPCAGHAVPASTRPTSSSTVCRSLGVVLDSNDGLCQEPRADEQRHALLRLARTVREERGRRGDARNRALGERRAPRPAVRRRRHRQQVSAFDGTVTFYNLLPSAPIRAAGAPNGTGASEGATLHLAAGASISRSYARRSFALRGSAASARRGSRSKARRSTSCRSRSAAGRALSSRTRRQAPGARSPPRFRPGRRGSWRSPTAPSPRTRRMRRTPDHRVRRCRRTAPREPELDEPDRHDRPERPRARCDPRARRHRRAARPLPRTLGAVPRAAHELEGTLPRRLSVRGRRRAASHSRSRCRATRLGSPLRPGTARL